MKVLRRLKRRLLRRWEGERILVRRFAEVHGRPLPRGSPRTFTEKLFRRMIELHRSPDPNVARLSDKMAVRDHVRRVVGAEHLVPLLWAGGDPRAIPYPRLPPAYVVKTNHGSGRVIRVNGDADPARIARRLGRWLESDHYWRLREAQYYRLPRRILVEEHLGEAILDYRFWCFHGRPAVCQVDSFAHNINPFYDPDFRPLDLSSRPDAARPSIPRPPTWERMLAVAADLARGHGFVRVDLYEKDGRVYFGELTFTPRGGRFRLAPERWDLELGRLW